MLTMILWLVFGPRIALAEIMGELAVGAILIGGGGGGRLRRLWRLHDVLPLPLRLAGNAAR